MTGHCVTGFTEPVANRGMYSEMLSVDRKVAVIRRAVDPVATVDPVALEKSISSATEALLGYRQSDGHWVFELEADSTIPAGIYPAAALPRRARRQRPRSQDRELSAPHARRPWRLAAGAGRPVRHERQRQILFRAEDDRRFRRRAAHGACARGDPQPRRRRPRQRFHAFPAGFLRRADAGARCRCCRSRSCCCRCGRRSTSTRSPTGRAPRSCR